jgi:hypothetical protein
MIAVKRHTLTELATVYTFFTQTISKTMDIVPKAKLRISMVRDEACKYARKKE